MQLRTLNKTRIFTASALMALLLTLGFSLNSTPSGASSPSCHPLTNSGHCYEPGEFCRHTDAGKRGIAGDGKRIVCRNNNGLRWEPY